jgi:hypothetical protein
MIVLITPESGAPVALLDIERTGIPALSLMALRFKRGRSAVQREAVIQRVLDGLVETGGHWSGAVEAALAGYCTCVRLPKLLVPRDHF